jgi:hypothetical protein
MQKTAKALKHLIIIGLLTLFTQTGGVIYLLCLPLFYRVNRIKNAGRIRFLLKSAAFLAIYLLINIFLVPPLAKWESGRVPLPVFGNSDLKPHQILYFAALNHHYVRPAVKASCERVAKQLAKQYPGTKLYYLDANFPFFDGYPLQPHYSHRNGITVDVALHWEAAKTGKPLDGAPFPLAYGISATPLPGEVDMEDKCNNPYRSIEMRLTNYLVREENYRLDEDITGEMIRLFLNEKSVHKILLEPHLKTRLGLGKADKIRFQGCKAARHDDHIHVIWQP